MFSFDPYQELGRLRDIRAMTLTSASFGAGEPLPDAQWGGQDVSPQLSWSGVPEGTKSFALSCFDPDAPTGSGFWHWAVYNIPADVRELAEGAGSLGGTMPESSITLRNETGTTHFIGAGPPAGTGVHRYFFTVDALDVETLDITPDVTPAILGFHRHFHTLARGLLVATAVNPADA